jgi:hypothetical protein
MFGIARAGGNPIFGPITSSGGNPGDVAADRNHVGLIRGERRVGERLVIGSRPRVRLRAGRRGLLGRKTEVAEGNLVQVSVTGALVVTSTPMRDVEVGTPIEIEVKDRATTAIVRRVVVHHDMTLYGLELVQVDSWFQALIDRAITESRGDLRVSWSTSR